MRTIEAKRDRRRIYQGAVVLAIAVTGMTTVLTGAFFTDSKTIGNNVFTTGTVILGVAPASAALTLPAMAPGDVVTAPITVSNTGSLAERYSVVSTTDATDANFLASALKMTIKTGVASCTTGGFAADGAAVYTAGVLGSTTGTKVLGDVTQGNQAGDRTLAALTSEVLCAQVTLPTTTGNTYQAKTTTATLAFSAEQTTNNP
ncbi:TasA family protein [Tessaracoccus sp.]